MLGLINRIGNGEYTNIWLDNWLPRYHMLRPICHKSLNPPQKVTDLIDHSTASWDVAKLDEHFLDMDKEIIMNIPLSSRVQDFWSWHYENRGVFMLEI